ELSKRRVCLVLASLFMMLQIWASVYLGWFLVLTLVIGSSIFLMQKKGRQDFKRLLGDPGLLVGLVILCIFGILPFLRIYAAGETVDRRIWYDIRHTLPTFASYLAAPDGSMLYHQLSLYKLAFLSSIPYQDLTPLFMGFIPAFILFYWLWKAYDNFRKKRSFQPFQGFLLKLLLLLFLLSFCFYKSVSFWQIIYGIVPGAGNIRGVSRYFLVMLIPYGFLIGYFVSNISMRLLAWCLLFGVMLENYNLNIGAYSNQAHLQRVQTVKIALAKVLVEKSCDAFYWDAEGEFYSVQLDAMWASLETGIPSLNGYSGGTPKNWSFTGFYQDQGRLQEMTETWLHEQEKPRVRVCLLPEA
ncbi:MAG: hypothetical protein NTX25_18680, partial [Proteobacteria bacterium]|nr:hypothetical protein [Pseudomonadota bacterium]